ncbi:MAG: cytidine deaminase [Chlorobi bacterium]|nr:cytidine deaminase [Chlorobiota bacterium]
MKKKEISLSVEVYDDKNEMTADMQNLVEKAISAGKNAYAPYSGFSVGAAVLLENGEIITGSNQENAAYPSGLCAERVAVFYASARYPDVPIKQLAVIAMKNGEVVDTPAAPCGACRQVLIEYEDKQGEPLSVILAGKYETIKLERSSDLLPFAFGSKELTGE